MKCKKTLALERVITATCESIIEHGYNSLSIAEIANLSRCSSATIYEIYGNKDNLYVDALGQLLHEWGVPMPRHNSNGHFMALFDYAAARVEYFEHPTTRRLWSALCENQNRGVHITRWLMDQRRYFGILAEIVEGAMAEHSVRKSDPEAVAYLVMAASSYEASAAGMILGTHMRVDRKEILRKLFTPLVLPAGERMLRSGLAALSVPEIDDQLPLSMHAVTEIPPQGPGCLHDKLVDLGIPSPYDRH